MMTAEVTNIGYRYGIQGSGILADPQMTVIGPTAASMCGSIIANTRTQVPEIAPQGANGLAITAFGGVGTGMLRIWRTG